ncbi:SWIM zinc finger family protein [Paenibacillus aurantius]|uniref:SWIM zinc finger family protein n=1 Tax=Paenibacillus aurantius TaxID=2918900 RepID=A0AA96LD43_9BACL|nr:SWIM zinc finger family protein [Paenibacillus aurantius]WNQ11130.1 SWIM zinc finger family protein [Paenibacillus aurantius]
MPSIKIPKNRIEYLIREAESRFQPAVLARGWDYFHQGRITPAELAGGTELHAQVAGSKRYEVTLDLEQFGRSRCTCPYDGWCKHMAAVLFQVYAPHGRPELLLVQLQRTIESKRRSAKSPSKTEKRPYKTDLSPTDSPAEWQAFFDRKFHGYSLSHQNSIEGFYQAAVQTLDGLASDWEPPLRELYRLHVTLFILRRADRFREANHSAYHSYYHEAGFQSVTDSCRTRLAKLAASPALKKAGKAYPKPWKETVDMVRQSLTGMAPGGIDWLDIYRLLWWDVFADGSAQAKERQKLASLLAQGGLSPRKRDVLLLASAHFAIMEGDDEQAMREMEGLHARHAGDFYSVLQRLSQEERWERLLGWLRWLLPVMPKAKQDDFNRICAFWMEAVKHQPTDEEWIRVMLTLLPRSYYYYTDYLMKTERFRQWVDLQLSNRVLPVNLYSADLKVVEAHDPALLLPLYTQAVERSIQEKNRASYTTAVRQLRKLHACYKKLKRLDRWEEYIHRLADKYSRLRAFQEELEKGKWLS